MSHHESLIPVNSSSIAAWGHGSIEGVNYLVIEFIRQGTFQPKFYKYAVELGKVLEFKVASSKGTYLNTLKKTHQGVEIDYQEVTEIMNGASTSSDDVASLTKSMAPIVLNQSQLQRFSYF